MPDTKQGRKTIVILSTEPWGRMLLSKMHYAIELAELGNDVFFVNPPRDTGASGLAIIAAVKPAPGVTVIDTTPVAQALFLRHKLFGLYRHWVTGRYAKAIRRLVAKPIDEVWCFDPHTYVDLSAFGAKRAVLLIYDFYTGRHVFRAAETADTIVSVSSVILDHYKETTPPKLLMQHGLGKHFAVLAEERLHRQQFPLQQGQKMKIGYTGNLLRVGMDTQLGRTIIGGHPEIEFHFWGPHSRDGNNVSSGEAPADLLEFIEFLKNQPNVRLHGVKEQSALAAALAEMDAFLFLYSAAKDLNGASNSHKLLEYLSTGKPVISTYVSNYAGTNLLEMGPRTEEHRLPSLFKEVTDNMGVYNSPERQQQRIRFALDNTYRRQVVRIREFIEAQK
jgi:glycosyltransferase involved in cell wall biosynthesis